MGFSFQAHMLKVFYRSHLRLRTERTVIERLFCEKWFPSTTGCFCPLPIGFSFCDATLIWFQLYGFYKDILCSD